MSTLEQLVTNGLANINATIATLTNASLAINNRGLLNKIVNSPETVRRLVFVPTITSAQIAEVSTWLHSNQCVPILTVVFPIVESFVIVHAPKIEAVDRALVQFPDLISKARELPRSHLSNEAVCDVAEVAPTIARNVSDFQLKNKGEGATLVIIDQFPKGTAFLNHPEFTDRPGGKPTLLDFLETECVPGGDLQGEPECTTSDVYEYGDHGMQVATVAAGAHSGIAKECNLVLVRGVPSLFPYIIAKIADLHRNTPTVVNLSWMPFLLRFDNGQDLGTEIVSMGDAVNTFLSGLKSTMPISFVVAAGNEHMEVCSTTPWYTLDDKIGTTIPGGFTLAATKKQLPFVYVGAAKLRTTDGPYERANFSNYGACVSGWAVGTGLCAPNEETPLYTITQGTSFAAPLAAAHLTLIKATRSGTTGELERQLLLESAPKVANETPNLLFKVSQETAGGAPLAPMPPEPETTNIIWYVIAGVMVLVLMLFLAHKLSKK